VGKTKVVIYALLIGLTVPSILAAWHVGFHDNKSGFIFKVLFFVALELYAWVFCGPGAALGCYSLFENLKKTSLESNLTLNQLMLRGAILAAVFSFLNFPGYLVAALFDGTPYWYIFVIILYLVSGWCSGAWIGFQAYKVSNPDVRLNYSLVTWILIILFAGFLMMLFSLGTRKPF